MVSDFLPRLLLVDFNQVDLKYLVKETIFTHAKKKKRNIQKNNLLNKLLW